MGHHDSNADTETGTGAGLAEPGLGAPVRTRWDPDQTEALPGILHLLSDIGALTGAHLEPMGLGAGLRPAADVDALLRAVASVEYELARRMHAAAAAGALPMAGPDAMPLARSWSAGWARRLARAGEFAARFPAIAIPWAAGVITSEHVDALARRASNLTHAEMSTLIDQLASRWGRHSPESLARFVQRVIRTLHPPPDPEHDEVDAYESRSLSFAVLGDTVILTGSLPRLEGEAVMAAVDAWAERSRAAGDAIPPGARRADGLVALVNGAAAAGTLPNRGGLPVALSVTLDHTRLDDACWATSGGHSLTRSEQRFTACSAELTPLVVARRPTPGLDVNLRSADVGPEGPVEVHSSAAPTLAARIAGLASTLLDEQIPLAVGRTYRQATPAQRRALAARDRGCVIPGCTIPAEACQAHHLVGWSAGGETSLSNLALLCWSHHREVDLGMWTIDPRGPDTSSAGAEAAWPGGNGSPWTITWTRRAWWRP